MLQAIRIRSGARGQAAQRAVEHFSAFGHGGKVVVAPAFEGPGIDVGEADVSVPRRRRSMAAQTDRPPDRNP